MEVYEALSSRLKEMKAKNRKADVITFAGNGEPTLHPEFHHIVDDSIALRDIYCPDTRIAILSNSSTLNKQPVRNALMKVDMNILKLDSAFDRTIQLHNQPTTDITVKELIKNLASFEGHVIIQTLFLKGKYKGKIIDNTTPEEIENWLRALAEIKPEEVMIYTIERETPEGGILKKVPERELNQIAARVEKLGIKTQVSG